MIGNKELYEPTGSDIHFAQKHRKSGCFRATLTESTLNALTSSQSERKANKPADSKDTKHQRQVSYAQTQFTHSVSLGSSQIMSANPNTRNRKRQETRSQAQGGQGINNLCSENQKLL